jgi:ribonuclease HI
VYPAELQAIAKALAAFPLACSLHIHSDSQASITGIRAYSAELNSRQRLRMAARQLLQLIHHQIEQRKAAGGSVQLEHVRAHSDAADIHSVGNRLTDYKANTARIRPQSATPSTLRELPLEECEHHLTVWAELGAGRQIIDDVRRTAISICIEQCRDGKRAVHGIGGWRVTPALQLLRFELRDGRAPHVVDDLPSGPQLSPHRQVMFTLLER